MNVRLFHSIAEITAWKQQWDDLNNAALRPCPFSTFAFFENFIERDDVKGQDGGYLPWLLLAFEAEQLVGYLPLKQSVEKVLGFKAPKLSFLVTHDTDRPHLVARPEDELNVATACVDFLDQQADAWSYLELRQQESHSPLHAATAQLRRGKYYVREWPSMENSTVWIKWNSLLEYFRCFSTKFRSATGRQMRALLAAGRVEILSSQDPHALPVLFELYRTIEPRSWKSRADAAISRSPERIRYFEGLMREGQPMRLWIDLVLLDGVPIAGLVSATFAQSLYALHMAFDESTARLGPGSALMLLGMRRAIEGGYRCFNWLSGFSYYKTRWLADVVPTRSSQVYRVGKPHFWKAMGGNVKRRLLSEDEQSAAVDFNPTRRTVIAAEGHALEPAARSIVVGQAQTARIDMLLEHLKSANVDRLNNADLGRLMPFDT
jgi:hypothetical protein